MRRYPRENLLGEAGMGHKIAFGIPESRTLRAGRDLRRRHEVDGRAGNSATPGRESNLADRSLRSARLGRS
jgi:hypothetical protein